MDGWIHVRCAVLCLNSWARQCSLSIKVPSRKQTKIVFFFRVKRYNLCMRTVWIVVRRIMLRYQMWYQMQWPHREHWISSMRWIQKIGQKFITQLILQQQPWNIYTYKFIGKSAYDVCVPRKCRSQNKSNGHTHIIHVMRGSIGSTAHKWLEQTAWIVSN